MALNNYYLDDEGGNNLNSMRSNLSRFETSGEFDAPDIAVEMIDRIERFEELEAAWNNLFDRISQPKTIFKSFNWHWHWVRNYLEESDSSLRIAAAWSGDELVMIWPLVLSTSFGVRQLKWMGAPVSQYGDVLMDDNFADPEIIRSVWNYITTHIQADVILLEKVRVDAQIAPVLKTAKTIVTGCMKAPYLDLASADNYTEYEKRYSGKSRKNRRRHRRRMGEVAEIKFEYVETGEEAKNLVKDAIKIKRQWLEANGLASRAYSDKRFDAFFGDVAGSTDRPCGCLVSIITSGSKPVAYDIGFQTEGIFIAHIGAYHSDFERFGPGSLLTEDFLKHAYDIGIDTYDLMAPSAPYKMAWADDCVDLCDYAYPLNGLGYAYAKGVNWFLRNAVKQVLEHTPMRVLQMTRPLFRLAGF